MSSKRLFVKRSWLNPFASDDTGHAHSSVEFFVWRGKKESTNEIDASFVLADCYRKVTINLSCDTQKDAKQRIKKLQLLIDHLYGIHDAIEDNMEKLK